MSARASRELTEVTIVTRNLSTRRLEEFEEEAFQNRWLRGQLHTRDLDPETILRVALSGKCRRKLKP